MVGNSEVMAEVALGPGKHGNRTCEVLVRQMSGNEAGSRYDKR